MGVFFFLIPLLTYFRGALRRHLISDMTWINVQPGSGGWDVSAHRPWGTQQRAALWAHFPPLSSSKSVCGGDDTDLPWQEAGRGEETSALSEEPVRVCALGPMVQLQGLRCQHLDLICNERRGGSFHFPRLRQLKFKNK